MITPILNAIGRIATIGLALLAGGLLAVCPPRMESRPAADTAATAAMVAAFASGAKGAALDAVEANAAGADLACWGATAAAGMAERAAYAVAAQVDEYPATTLTVRGCRAPRGPTDPVLPLLATRTTFEATLVKVAYQDTTCKQAARMAAAIRYAEAWVEPIERAIAQESTSARIPAEKVLPCP